MAILQVDCYPSSGALRNTKDGSAMIIAGGGGGARSGALVDGRPASLGGAGVAGSLSSSYASGFIAGGVSGAGGARAASYGMGASRSRAPAKDAAALPRHVAVDWRMVATAAVALATAATVGVAVAGTPAAAAAA